MKNNFRTALKKQFGMGFAEYLRTLRIKHAVLLFEKGVTPVKNVALLCGFSDPLYPSDVTVSFIHYMHHTSNRKLISFCPGFTAKSMQ